MAIDFWGGVEGTVIATKQSSKLGDFEGCLVTALDRAKDSLTLWTVMTEGGTASKEIKNTCYKELKKQNENGDTLYEVKIYFANSYKHMPAKLVARPDMKTALTGQVAAFEEILQSVRKNYLDLNDPGVSTIYNAAKEQRKPKKVTGNEKKAREPRLQTIEDGGESYWSETKHTWIKGKIVNKIYTSPAPNQ